MTPDEEFQMEQFRSLRTEINNNTAEIRSIQRYSLVAVAVVWSWIATNPAPIWAAFMPLAFIVLNIIHTTRVLYETRDMGLFIAGQTEPFFSGRSLPSIGWEDWLRTVKRSRRNAWYEERLGRSTKTRVFHNPLISVPLWLLWLTLTICVVTIGCLNIVKPLASAKQTKCYCATGVSAAVK